MPFEWRWARESRGAIARHWTSRVSANPNLFNGPVLLAADVRVEGEVAHVAFFETDFASFLAAKDWGFPDPTVANGFAMAALRASDGAFLLGEMGPHTASEGRTYFPSGTPDRSDLRLDGAVDLAGSVERELAEETGLTAQDGIVHETWVIVRDGGYLAFMRPIDLHEPAAAVRSRILRFLARESVPELRDAVIVRGPEDIDESRTPSFVGAYLRDAWAREPAQR